MDRKRILQDTAHLFFVMQGVYISHDRLLPESGDSHTVCPDSGGVPFVVRPGRKSPCAPEKYLPLLETPGSVGTAHPVKGSLRCVGLLRSPPQRSHVILEILPVGLGVLLHHSGQELHHIDLPPDGLRWVTQSSVPQTPPG